jgi:hypothetical protein
MLTWLAKLLQSDKDISADLPTIVAAGDVLEAIKKKIRGAGRAVPRQAPGVFQARDPCSF